MCYICSENKGVDQLYAFVFVYAKTGFLMTRFISSFTFTVSLFTSRAAVLLLSFVSCFGVNNDVVLMYVPIILMSFKVVEWRGDSNEHPQHMFIMKK